jgi:hypothetical protein
MCQRIKELESTEVQGLKVLVALAELSQHPAESMQEDQA